jgi:hypothetical protein
MRHATQRQCGSTRIPAAPGGQVLSARQGPARSRAVVGSCSRFRLAVAAGAEARRRARLASQTPSRTGPPALPCPAGPFGKEVSERSPGGRVRYRSVDVCARGRGHPADLRGQLSSGPCVAAGAESGREPPDAQAPCPRARRGSPAALAHTHLAAAQKKCGRVTLISYWRCCPCFIGRCRRWVLVRAHRSVQRAAGRRLWHPRLLWRTGPAWLPADALKLNPGKQVWNRSQYRGLASNVSSTWVGLPEAVGLSRAGKPAHPVPLQSVFPPAEFKLGAVSLAMQVAITAANSGEGQSLCPGPSPRTRR